MVVDSSYEMFILVLQTDCIKQSEIWSSGLAARIWHVKRVKKSLHHRCSVVKVSRIRRCGTHINCPMKPPQNLYMISPSLVTQAHCICAYIDLVLEVKTCKCVLEVTSEVTSEGGVLVKEVFATQSSHEARNCMHEVCITSSPCRGQ